MESEDLLFSFTEKLDVAIASSNTEFNSYLPDFLDCSEFILFLLEFTGKLFLILIEIPDKKKRKSALQYLYRIALGMFDSKENTIIVLEKPNKAISIKNCQLLYQCDCLEEMIKLTFEQLDELEKILKVVGGDTENLLLLQSEQEVRMATSIVSLIAVYHSNNEEFRKDFVDPKYRVEELCLKVFKMSLDIAIVPIKKFLCAYCIYLDSLFGGPPRHTVEPVRCLMKELYITEFKKKQDKMNEPTNPVEEFYVFPRL